MLSHELNNDTMIEAQTFLPQIAGAFKNVVPVGTCQNITKYDHPYAFPSSRIMIRVLTPG